MDLEINMIEKNKTWDRVNFEKDTKLLVSSEFTRQSTSKTGQLIDTRKDSLWNATGKTRCEPDIDYQEVFAPIARLESVRLLIASAVQNKWKIH